MAIVSKDTPIIHFNNGYYCDSNRYDFINAIKQIMGCGTGEDICHYISFDYMKNVLCVSADMFYNGTLTQAEFADNIRNLADAVTTGIRYPVSGQKKTNIDAIYNNINSCVTFLMSVTDNTQDVSDSLNQLLYCLNSADANLRPGDSSWNRSLGNLYDPYGWVHIGPDGRIDNGNLNLTQKDLQEVYSDTNCFHLANDTDCRKYHLLCQLHQISPPALYSAVYNELPILYSSCNFDFGLDPNFNSYSTCTDTIYYS